MATAPRIGTPEHKAVDLLKKTSMFHLDQQQRSINQTHTDNIKQLTTMDSTVFPFTSKLMSHYPPINAEDIKSDHLWKQAPIIVVNNEVRHAINYARLVAYAKEHKTCILSWRSPLSSQKETEYARHLTPVEIERLYLSHRALTGYFCPGVTSYVIDNINTDKGIVNGAHCTQHSITLSTNTPEEKEYHASLLQRIAAAEPGEVIMLDCCPVSINVEITHADLTKYSKHDTLVPNKAVVPIPMVAYTRYEIIKAHETFHQDITRISYKSVGLELGFAITFQKTQGRTIERLILDLNVWPSGSIGFEMALVGMTRVRDLKHIRMLPLLPGQSLNHVYKLQANKFMLAWRAGYNDPGPRLVFGMQMQQERILRN